MASVVADPIAKIEDEGHEDLVLSPEEAAEEAAERAANAERELGAVDESVQAVYDRVHAETLAAERQALLEREQAALDEDDGSGKVESLKEEAGEAVGEMPAGEPDGSVVPPETLAVTGPSSGKLRWHGKQPTTTFITIGAMKIEVPEGDFKKGERFSFEGEAVVTSEAAVDKLDKDTKTAVEAQQQHKATVLDFALTDAMSGE